MMKCTHIALQVRDIGRSIAFYERYCGMQPVHVRGEPGDRVVWIGWGEQPPKFVIVLIERDYEHNQQPPWQHIGMAVESRREVDERFAMARADGSPVHWPPTDAGEIVGYFCGVVDPDGNVIEFSHGQKIG